MTQPFTATPSGNVKLDLNFQELSQRSIRSEGREGQHIEGGVTLNDLEVDVDFLVKALSGVVGLFVDGANGRVGIGTATPGTLIHGRSSVVADLDILLEHTGAQFVSVRLKNSAREWRFRNTNAGAFQLVDVNAGTVPWNADPGAPTNSIRLVAGAVILRDLRIVGRTSTAADPTTTELPADKDFGIHKNTSSGAVFLAYNDGGAIKKVALT